MGLRSYDDLVKATKTDIDALIKSLDPDKATLKEYLAKMTLKDWLKKVGLKEIFPKDMGLVGDVEDIGLLGDQEPPQKLKWTKMAKHMLKLEGVTSV